IIASSVGNALEFYEILVYGYFAVTISKVFFPAANEAVSILVTLGTFGISFLARPVGAIFLGAYGDRKGRKNALTLSILLMTIGTGLMTVMPSYASAGLLAPILVIAARLLQGFSVGGEFASSTAFLVEHRPDRAGFFASWQWSSQGVLLTTSMSADTLQAWGWRIPFAVGLLIGPVGYYIRHQLDETPEFIEAGEARTPLRDLFVGQWDRLLLTIGAVAASTSSQYLLVYMPTYAIRELNLPQSIGFTAAMLAAALQTVAVPFVGIWVDKVGQTRVMIGAAILFMVTAYPAFVLLGVAPSLGVLIAMVCWISLLKSFFSGALPSLMAKTFPVATRVSGMSLSYNISVPIFGGFAPFFAQSLIDLAGSKLAPSYYMIATATLSLLALLIMRRRYQL
ncbi:MAG TPA: MFS transporter, partial [Xanthobacteraceae bacterium]